jgi:hypothetical protein
MYFSEIRCIMKSSRNRLGKEVPTENMDENRIGGKTG